MASTSTSIIIAYLNWVVEKFSILISACSPTTSVKGAIVEVLKEDLVFIKGTLLTSGVKEMLSIKFKATSCLLETVLRLFAAFWAFTVPVPQANSRATIAITFFMLSVGVL